MFLFLLGYLPCLLALDNGLARTPPMGWMSWTVFMCETDCVNKPNACINEKLYMDMADRMVADGYRDAGYKGVHIDDCWSTMSRDNRTGRLIPDPSRFPNGMKSLAKYMHDRGLTFGIYEDYGTKTCAGYPGSLGYLEIDAQTFAEWDVDYLKLDGCNVNIDLMPIGYPQMERALNATGRPIVYSCSWPAYLYTQPNKVNYTKIGESCNLWRNFADISNSWASIAGIIAYYDANQDRHIPSQGPGKWHDPDMLVIGNQGITVDMAIAQMTIWSMWSAPLIMSNDLRNIGDEFKKILLNKKVIAIDQDPLSVMGRLVANTTNIGLYVKPVTPTIGTRTSYAFAVLNRNTIDIMKVEFTLEHIGLTDSNGYIVENLWTGENLGIMRPSDWYSAIVNPTSAAMLKATIIDPTLPSRQLWKFWN